MMVQGGITLSAYYEDKLLITNTRDFYYCSVCGYTMTGESFKGKNNPEYRNKQHEDRFGFSCSNKQLQKVTFGHIFVTDVVKLHISTHLDYAHAVTVLYSLLEGLSHSLQVEREDINGIVAYSDLSTGIDLILFDSVPGGAGHVSRLMNEQDFLCVLNASLEILKQPCCSSDSTCSKCLQNYWNQDYHDMMKKKYAIDFLEEILNNPEVEE